MFMFSTQNMQLSTKGKLNFSSPIDPGGARGRLLPAVKSGTIDLSELLTSAGNMKKSRVCRLPLILSP